MSMTIQDYINLIAEAAGADDLTIEVKTNMAQDAVNNDDITCDDFAEMAAGLIEGAYTALMSELMPEAAGAEDDAVQGWKVVLFDDDQHTVGEVAQAIHEHMNVPVEDAVNFTLEAHEEGTATFGFKSNEQAYEAYNSLREQGLTVGIMPITE